MLLLIKDYKARLKTSRTLQTLSLQRQWKWGMKSINILRDPNNTLLAWLLTDLVNYFYCDALPWVTNDFKLNLKGFLWRSQFWDITWSMARLFGPGFYSRAFEHGKLRWKARVQENSSASFKILEKKKKNRRESQIRELKESDAVKQGIRMRDTLNPHQCQTQMSKAKKQPLGLETELRWKSQPNVSTHRMRELGRSWWCFRDGPNISSIVFLGFVISCFFSSYVREMENPLVWPEEVSPSNMQSVAEKGKVFLHSSKWKILRIFVLRIISHGDS